MFANIHPSVFGTHLFLWVLLESHGVVKGQRQGSTVDG